MKKKKTSRGTGELGQSNNAKQHAISIKMSESDHARLLKQSTKLSMGHSTLARQYILQRLEEEEKKDK